MDARWDVVRKANLFNDHGGPRPTDEEYELIYSLADEIVRSLRAYFKDSTYTEITDRELGQIMCPDTDIEVARCRVWQWRTKGKQRNPAACPYSFPVNLS